MSPFQDPPAIKAYPIKIPDNTFFPNWWMRRMEQLVLWMILQVFVHTEFSRLPGGLRHFADSNSIPWNLTTIFQPIQIAIIRLMFLLLLVVQLVLQFRVLSSSIRRNFGLWRSVFQYCASVFCHHFCGIAFRFWVLSFRGMCGQIICEWLQPIRKALRWILLVHLVFCWTTVSRGRLVKVLLASPPAFWLVTSSLWGGRGRRRCPHTRWSRSSAGFPWTSCWAPSAARRWGGRRTRGRLGSREWSSSRRGRTHGWHVDDREWSADKCKTWANVSVMKCARNKTTCARSVELFVDVHVGNRWCAVSSSCQRRHWCSHCRAFRPACCCTLCRPDSPCCDTVSIHPTLFP